MVIFCDGVRCMYFWIDRVLAFLFLGSRVVFGLVFRCCRVEVGVG